MKIAISITENGFFLSEQAFNEIIKFKKEKM